MTPKEAIQKIKDNIGNSEKENPSVSKTNVAWQLDHSLKVIIAICESILGSDPEKYQPKTSFLKSVILKTGFIPRGKARAPKAVNNRGVITLASLKEQIIQAEKLINEIEKLPANSFYTHHMFGDLDLKSTLKFMGIHTNHHIKIIKDIVK